jgi:hypothetical protein
MATVADYSDAVERIIDKVDDDSTTEEEIRQDLRQEGGPQLTDKVISNLFDAIGTESDVIESLESMDGLPSSGEIDSIADVLDQYDTGKSESVSDAVRERVATIEDVQSAVAEAVSGTDQPRREDIESAVSSVDGEIVGPSVSDVTTSQAQEQGAPAESDVRRESAQVVQQAGLQPDQVLDDPTELDGVAEGTASSDVPVVRNQNGQVVGLAGARTDELGEAMADEIGAEYLGSITSVASELETTGSGESVDLELRGETVGSVDVR